VCVCVDWAMKNHACQVCFITHFYLQRHGGCFQNSKLIRPINYSALVRGRPKRSVVCRSVENVKSSSVPEHPSSSDNNTTSVVDTKSHNGYSVRTVAETISDFLKRFRHPIPSIYRTIVQELLVTTHLARVSLGFQYDPVFALGFQMVTQVFFKSYPKAAEKEQLFDSMCKALLLDYERIKKDAAMLEEWTKTRTEQDILQAMETGGQDEISNTLYSIGQNEWFVYSRLFGLGLVRMMELCGEEANSERCKRWASALHISSLKLEQDLDTYQQSLERLKQAEQLFAELEARQKKKLAEKLAERAKRAQEEAMKAEQQEKS
jgi:photosystem II biogenesis protein Psp29